MRARKSLLWYIYPALVAIIFGTVVTLCFFSVSLFQDIHKRQAIANLKVVAALVGTQVQSTSDAESSLKLSEAVNRLQADTNLLFAIFDSKGQMLASIPNQLQSQISYPEVEQAIQTGLGTAERFLSFAGGDILFVAVPVQNADKTTLIAAVGLPVKQIDQSVAAFWWRSLIIGALLTLLATGFVWFVTRKILSNLADIQGTAEQFAAGNLSFRASLPKQAELAKLVHAMNRMAHELDDRLKQVINQRNQLDAVLAAMNESVLAFDLEQRVIFLNAAAQKLFGITINSGKHQALSDIVRNISIIELVSDLLTNKRPVFSEFKYGNGEQITLQARGTILFDNGGKALGGLIVLNDISELRRLETVRTDFVANVSHELRTPITSIKGFVETLLAGNVSAADQQRFLEIIAKHSNRLVSIIDDLLDLSVLEQQSHTAVETESVKISEIVDAAIDTCRPAAKAKSIGIDRSCREGLTADLPGSLLQQALVNYIDNAIKYSEESSTIRVEVNETDQELVFSVSDNGSGIAPEHHSRLFERFYRVDKARSSSVGGTGLGLSIVKHIAQSMGGYPSVKSSLGHGSTFQIHIPTITSLQS